MGGGQVELAQPVTLTVIFFGTGTGYAYQWRKNGVTIPGATSASLSFTAVTASDAGAYAVTVTNADGSSVASTDLIVKPLAPPVITSHPRTTVVQVGQQVVFGFTATGSYPRTHQWRRDGVPIAGATSPTYTIAAVTTEAAGVYSVIVTNSEGSATSLGASLTVNAAIPVVLFASTPVDATYTQGNSATISVSIGSGSQPFTYQWRKNGAAIPGATTAQLVFAAISPSDAGLYSVVVSNPAGSATSREATITVNPATPVTITSQPRAISVVQGQSASFSVGVTGSSPVRFQWMKNGTPIANATSSYYNISAATAADAGDYSVLLSNIVSSITSAAATLTVTAPIPPTITTQPADVSVTDGDAATFSVRATGSEPLTYQWYFNDARLSNDGSSLNFTARLGEGGGYHVVISNAAGSVTSRTATLSVSPQPPPPVARVGNVWATLGQSFSISSSYFPFNRTPTYQWYRNGVLLPGANSSTYSVSAARLEDAGDYFVVITTSGGTTTSHTGRVELLQNRTAPPGAWVAAERGGDIAYFAFSNPARIERYNLTTAAWLPTITLARAPAAFAVSDSNLFIGAGSILYRYALDGSGEVILNSGFNASITGLAVSGAFVLAHAGSSLNAIRIADGVRMSAASYSYNWSAHMASAPGLGRLFSRTSGISPSDITTATIQPNGTLSTRATDSPYHGSYPDAQRVFVSPNEAFVADDGGTIYRTADLRFVSGLGGALDDLVFTSNNRPVIARGGVIVTYDDQFREVGRLASGIATARIFLQGDQVFAFGYPPSGASIPMARLALSQASGPVSADPVDAATAAYSPDSTFIDRDGVVCLFSKLHRQIFRWSSSERRYLAPITLQGWPSFVTYSPTTHRLYLGYADTRILQVRLDAGRLTEESFANAPRGILGLITAGEYVFLIDPTSPWISYFLFAPNGQLLAQRDWSYYGSEYVWNPVLRRVYQFRDDTSPNDLLYTEVTAAGAFGPQRDSPYHGEIGTRYPIRISPDGSAVLLGSGRFYDANTMVANNSIANPIDDATWVNNRLVTARAASAGVELQRWGGGNYALDRTRVLGGRLKGLFTLAGNRALLVTVRDGIPFFTILNENLDEISVDLGGAPTRLVNLATRALAGRDAQMLIPGFVIAGAQPKRVLVRAAGPALTPFGVSGVLDDPRLAVLDATGNSVASNDDWSAAQNVSDLLTVTARVGAFAFSSGSRDAAALVTLAPGAYTVQARGAGDTTGVALVEIYDAQDAGNTSRIVNIAARAQVGAGADVLIPGIVIQGIAPKAVLIRAVGPGLNAFGVSGTLTDPKIRLFRGDQLLFENDNWGQSTTASATQIASAGVQTGAFALTTGSRDAALLLTLAPGAYTAHVSGADGGAGVALVEVYEVP